MVEIKATPGDYVKFNLARKAVEGYVLESYDKSVILLKLASGYNIGINRENILDYKVLRKFKQDEKEFKLPSGKGKPVIGLIVTGGTIASKLDATTGAVKPLTSVSEFARFYPKLFAKVGVKKVEVPFMIASEDMTPQHWKKISEIAVKMLNDGEIKGVIITHGTDTLHYTAAALSFFLRNLNKPVVLTFSQRSSDRASSDADLNLDCAAQMALSDCAEVVIVGHSSMNDDFCYALRGTKVRKMHTSRRDAFKPINTEPIAKVWSDKVEFLTIRRPRNNEKVELDYNFSDKVALIKFYPGQDPKILEHYLKEKYKGIVIEMTGFGHVNSSWVPTLKKVIKSGLIVCATAQTIYGKLNPKVYSPGREFEKAGVIYLEDMLSETAFVKLGFVLGHKNWKGAEKVKEKMLESFAGEINELLTE